MNNPLDALQLDILTQVSGLGGIPTGGAYNIRVNGVSAGRASSENIAITPKPAGAGIDIRVKPGTKGETVYIPVVISQDGHTELVYNDFFIGEGADVTIIAGCGIHNCGEGLSQHDGIHTFHLEKGSRAVYEEKHFGAGDGSGKRILNPVTNVHLAPGSHMEMDTVQIKGVDSTRRMTYAKIGNGAKLLVREKLMTHGDQFAETTFEVDLCGEDSAAHVISRAVAKGSSRQVFLSKVLGNSRCTGRTECDAIIMDGASVSAIPEIAANNVNASLVHEAAIGRIAGEQLTKLMTLGLTEQEAEEQIVNGFLK